MDDKKRLTYRSGGSTPLNQDPHLSMICSEIHKSCIVLIGGCFIRLEKESTNQSYVGETKNGKVIFPSMKNSGRKMATKEYVTALAVPAAVSHNTKTTTFKSVYKI